MHLVSRSPGAPRLLLVPTELERRRLEDHGGLPAGFALQHLAGFGPIAAAARTAALIQMLKPSTVLLVGIAGTYNEVEHPVGSALAFSRVAVEGVGVGEGERFLGPPALGFPQWPGDRAEERVDDVIDLAIPASADEALLLSTCAASDSPAHAAHRRAHFPTAAAEDMEGFAVALACTLAGVPCGIVRGISNVVGDRDPSNWRIPSALSAARQLLLELFGECAWDLQRSS